jgi:hypothetical protein
VVKRSGKPKIRGGFFAIDRRTWGRLCDSAGINEAAAYLVLAQGTGRDNRLTKWSVTSLKKYAGISWERGTLVINRIADQGFIRRAEASTKSKPQYEILSWAEIAPDQFRRTEASLSDSERDLVREIRNGTPRRPFRGAAICATLQFLEEKGMVTKQEQGVYVAVDAPTAPSDPDLIWLPNTLITGTIRGEDSPVGRLRRAGDIWTLRLLVDLYHAQNLRDDGGICPRCLRQYYERTLIGAQGRFNVWAFKPGKLSISWEGPLGGHLLRPHATVKEHPIWSSINSLRQQGLLAFIPHLWDNECDSGSAQGEVIHSYGIGESGEPLEIAIGTAAQDAGFAMLPEFKREKAYSEGFYHFAPIPKTLANVQMIGVARLRYRPHTSRTRDWYGDLTRNAEGWISRYREMQESAEIGASKTA